MKLVALLLFAALASLFACGGLGYGTWDISYDCYPGGVRAGDTVWECIRSVCESGMCSGSYTVIDIAYVAAPDGRACYEANSPPVDETSTRIECAKVGIWQTPHPGEPGGKPNASEPGGDT